MVRSEDGSYSSSTATGKMKCWWRGVGTDRCHPETHNGSSCGQEDRSKDFPSGLFKTSQNFPSLPKYSIIRMLWSLARALDAEGVGAHFLLHLGSLRFSGDSECCCRDLQPIFKISNILWQTTCPYNKVLFGCNNINQSCWSEAWGVLWWIKKK